MASPTDTSATAYAVYDRTTSRWGRLTMLLGLLFSYAGPVYLVLFSGLEIPLSDMLTAFLAVAAVFAILAVVEPITYYPVLGPAAMYQAFMIGNIANKLLPSAIVAQAAIGAKPGTRRAELAAVMAICGAAVVHIFSLLLFVGILGTWLVSVVPEPVVEVARLYIFPAIIGAVIVQLAAYVKQPRILLIALAVGAVVQLLLVPVLGTTFRNFATAVVVLATMVLAWVLRDRKAEHAAPGDESLP
ncbi:hypothetical protein [uncultured Kocuria sp.]|uniref:hypothetical protein n=1 Tax=uncultured Kocuria sp. TaxID=259305 RepID=UPI0026327658|nr:hypothetical protein [uncultured Kocuria sp.]